jgi:diacylglycerol O-acyltransferase
MNRVDLEPEVLDELSRWGGPNQMSAFESLMWRAEVDPRLRSTTTSVFFLDQAPDWDRFYQGHQWLINVVPRFRQRVVEPAFGLGAPTWVDDADFHLDYHLRRMRLPAPGSERQMFDVAQTLAMTPFDRARSPWEGTLIEGMEGGRAAYVLKLHHATSDGMGVIQLLSRVLQRDRAPVAASERTPMGRRRRALTAGELARNRVLALPQEAAGSVGSLLQSIGQWARAPGASKKAADYADSAKRMLSTRPVAGSPLFKRRSLSWRFDAIELPVADLKRAARAAGGSINDVFLAGLIGGFRRYHDVMGVSLQQIPVGFPISLRKEGDPPGGNKFAGSQYAAPVGELDPIARVRHIQTFVGEIRKEPALDVMVRLMPLLVRLPIGALVKLTADMFMAQDAQISNIPGIAEPVYMAGSQVTHFWPFAPVPGCGMMITMITHNGHCCIGINSDRAAVMDPELLTQCLREGLQEMIALADGAGAAASPVPKKPAVKKSRKKAAA